MRSAFVLLLCVGGLACNEDAASGPVRKPPPPPDTTGVDPDTGSTSMTNDESSTGAPFEACSADVPCPAASFCAAPNAGGSTVGAGPYACSTECVVADDPGRWCLDASSCCDAAATCELGFCRVAGSDSSGGSSSEASTSGSTTDTSTSG